jgi:hypothetical protein
MAATLSDMSGEMAQVASPLLSEYIIEVGFVVVCWNSVQFFENAVVVVTRLSGVSDGSTGFLINSNLQQDG